MKNEHIVPICSIEWKFLNWNLEENRELFKKYKEKYLFDNWYLQYTTAIIKNRNWEIYVAYNKKHKSWQVPSWKVDKWENIKSWLYREIKEELWINITKTKYLWNIKVNLHWMIWQGHFFEIIDYNWKIKNCEKDRHKDWVWFKIIDFDNKLWFAFKKWDEIISDDVEMLSYRKDEIWYKTIILNEKLNNIKVDFPIFEKIDNKKKYLQYFDIKKNKYWIIEEYKRLFW